MVKGRYLDEDRRAAIFKATDRNGDNEATEKEYVENRIITDEGKAIFSSIDANGDIYLTEKEFQEFTEISDPQVKIEAFNLFDADGNLRIEMIEYLRIYGKLARE